MVPEVGSSHWLARRGRLSCIIDGDRIVAKIDRALRAKNLFVTYLNNGVHCGFGSRWRVVGRKIGRADHQPRGEAVEFDQRARAVELRLGADQNRFSSKFRRGWGNIVVAPTSIAVISSPAPARRRLGRRDDKFSQSTRLSAGSVHKAQ